MRLHEHKDFAAFVTAAASENELPEVFVEKDYWITEILRVIATTLPDRAIFKGGTSLSKGWALLDRSSEDIDPFVDPLPDPFETATSQIRFFLSGLGNCVLAVSAGCNSWRPARPRESVLAQKVAVSIVLHPAKADLRDELDGGWSFRDEAAGNPKARLRILPFFRVRQ